MLLRGQPLEQFRIVRQGDDPAPVPIHTGQRPIEVAGTSAEPNPVHGAGQRGTQQKLHVPRNGIHLRPRRLEDPEPAPAQIAGRFTT